MEENLIFTVEHNSLGLRGVYTDPAKVIEYLKEEGIQNQDDGDETWTRSTLIFVWKPNTIEFESNFSPEEFVKHYETGESNDDTANN